MYIDFFHHTTYFKMKQTFLLLCINFGVVFSQFQRPVTSLNARVQYKPNIKNDMSKIQDLMKLLPKKQHSTSRLTKASDYEYCMDKVPIYKMLLEKAFIPRMLKFFIMETIGFTANLILLTASFICLYRYVKSNPIGK